MEVLHCRNSDFRPFCTCDLDRDLLTFIYKLDPYSLEIQANECANMNFFVKAFVSYRVTDRRADTTEIIYHAPFRGWLIRSRKRQVQNLKF